jgi:catechol 2,3-dioxygenase-like lactoylglutathione lyase family enzyme
MLQRLDHVGVVVDDLESAKRFFGDVLKLELARELALPNLKAAFYRCGDASIELIEVLDAAEREQRLGQGLTARIEHLAFEVDRLEPVMEPLRDAGFLTTTEQPRVIGANRNYFTLADSSHGIMLQFFDRRAEG